jgi:hypothetical protein
MELLIRPVPGFGSLGHSAGSDPHLQIVFLSFHESHTSDPWRSFNEARYRDVIFVWEIVVGRELERPIQFQLMTELNLESYFFRWPVLSI